MKLKFVMNFQNYTGQTDWQHKDFGNVRMRVFKQDILLKYVEVNYSYIVFWGQILVTRNFDPSLKNCGPDATNPESPLQPDSYIQKITTSSLQEQNLGTEIPLSNNT